MLVERLSPRWSSTGLTHFLGRPGQCGYFYATPTGGLLAAKYDLACCRPHTRRILSGVGFRAWNPRPQGPDLATRPRRPSYLIRFICMQVRYRIKVVKYDVLAERKLEDLLTKPKSIQQMSSSSRICNKKYRQSSTRFEQWDKNNQKQPRDVNDLLQYPSSLPSVVLR
ncbi:hypothetical protein AVEN_72983-1 [Araneus ventricosus]|uniref:Uncharacterized protein n=1 Tax=Araneus ventricosus TaxID=182803 RepID=A0A4Y2SVM6_ARAVE|nr:hypothetical protein AVEN_72983-1 [Araneus ventricosus]